ncbi:sugar phosphate isomerase/epimerase family protein [Alkalibacter saccharofermentans]|uniref:Sugar phosphate isomerase/epimerase n=1 Tax=Alkalibacter saccharofermentans DSM 14828 TaxID=1120975 RepID=A0A1M4W3W3_9FIRM|nr:TIM barrel protein [Alkalibacter saccharofermentans]SHE75928.1 Sugar phosphate isomerase/epimerase [Alkalibacter saccharofermentans DSM 14828]
MNKGLIGVQMMMLKEKVEEMGVRNVMEKLSSMGYHCVEVSQIPMTPENVENLKKSCQEFDIKIAALSASIEPMFPGMPGEYLSTDFDKIVSDCKTLGCSFLRIGMLPMTLMGSREKALEFVKIADGYGKKLAEHGIKLYYHNHHVEFERYEGETLLEIIKNNTEYLGFELDVHWIQRGGMDPVEVIKSFDGRVTLLHLKDYRIGKLEIDFSKGFDMKEFMAKFTGVVEFAEVGEGNLDMPGIIQAGLESGSKYFLIEQDDQYGKDPFDCLKTSRDNLIKMGYEDWFKLD